MARGGINKANVKSALQSLQAKGINPSIDAIRAELGNTGSKSTIHRYLSELMEENPAAYSAKNSLSEALTQMVASLAEQLQQESQAVIDEQADSHLKVVETLRLQYETLSKQYQAANTTIAEQAKRLELLGTQQVELSSANQELRIQVAQLTQELKAKEQLLSERDNHIQSLESKHQHAREALEHYRSSVQEQRDQDQRRHEHQIQQLQTEQRQLSQTVSIKQTEITQLNKDNARLLAEHRELQKQLNHVSDSYQAAVGQVKHAEAQKVQVEHQRDSSKNKNDELEAELRRIQSSADKSESKHRELELENQALKTELRVKEELYKSFARPEKLEAHEETK